MADFQDNLGAPGDYQRPVATKGGGVDIFGAVADLWQNVNQVGRKSDSGPSPAEKRAEATAEGLDVFAAGAAAIMTDGRNGPGANILSFFGADSKTTFVEMQKVNEAAAQGEITPAVREIQLERLIAGVMGKYPEASYEIMGQALSQLGIDHAYARKWKLDLELQRRAETDAMEAESEAYKVGAGAGFTGSRDWVVSQGKAIQRRKFVEEDAKRAMELQILLADKNSKLTAAERTRLEAEQKVLGSNIANGILYQNAIGITPVLDILNNFSQQAGSDLEMNKEFLGVLQQSKAALQAGRSRAQALLASVNAPADEQKRVDEWFNTHDKFINDLASGDTSNQKTTIALTNIMKNSAAIEASEVVPTYQKMTGALGQGLVTAILQGAVPGISPSELDFLRKELIEGFAAGRTSSEEARRLVTAFQAAKDGTAIPREQDEGQRKNMMNSAATIIKAELDIFMKDPAAMPSGADLDNFSGASASLLSAIYDDAPTITLENLDKVNPMFSSAKWRHAAGKLIEGSANSEAAVKLVQFNTVTTAKILNKLKKEYQDTGQVEYDATRQRYIPVKTTTPTPMGPRQLESGRPQTSYQSAASPEAIKAAEHMNALLSHLEQVDTNLIEVVPDDKLMSKDAEGSTTKMTIKDVFATDAGFTQSLENFSQFFQPDEVPQSLKDQFFEQTLKFKQNDTMRSVFDYSKLTSSNAALQARINATEIDLMARDTVRVPVTDLKSYMANMVQTEGPNHAGGKPHDPSRSTAAGRYGFLTGTKEKPGTWDEWVQKAAPSTRELTFEQRKELMKDPALEDAVMEAFTYNNITLLQQGLGYTPSWEEVNLAHLLGPGDAVPFIKELKKNPNAPAASVLPARVVEKNPELTKGTLLDLWNMRLRRSDPDWSSYLKDRHGVDAGMPATDLLEDLADENDLYAPSAQ